MNKTINLLYLVIPLFLLACSGKTFKESKNKVHKQPNIIFILADDLGWRDVGFNGSVFYETPNLDSLSAKSINFTNGYANAPNCAPTRASILSGQYTCSHGIVTVHQSDKGDKKAQRLIPYPNTDTLPVLEWSMPRAMKKAGYQTGFFGKWHLGGLPNTDPLAQGFDVNIGGFHRGSPKSYFSPYSNPVLQDGPEGEHLTDRLTDEAINFINHTIKDKPFFAYLSYYAVHNPFETKPELQIKYESKEVVDGQKFPTYAGMIETLDVNIGKLINHLKNEDLLDNTIIVFASDNGGSHKATDNSPLRGYKGTMYEGGIRVPFLVYAPNLYGNGKALEIPVITTDILPSMLDWAGVPLDSLSEKYVGESIHSIVTNKRRESSIFWYSPVYLPARDFVKGAYGFRTTPASVIRKGDFKLLWFYEEENMELYNVKTDLSEENNLAEELPEKYQELKNELLEWHSANNVFIPSELNPLYDSVYTATTYKELRY